MKLLRKHRYILATLSGDVISKDKSLKTTQVTLACFARVSIHFLSKIRCFWREKSNTQNISDLSISGNTVTITMLLRSDCLTLVSSEDHIFRNLGN